MSGAEGDRDDWSMAARAAAAELGDHLRRISGVTAGMRLAAFRRYHGETCRTASPLAFSLATHMGVDLDAVARKLEPNGPAPWWLVGGSPDGSEGALGPDGKMQPPFGLVLDRFLFGGAVERWPDGGGDAFGVRVSPAGLEIGVLIDGLGLHTRAGLAELELPLSLPELTAVALVGKPLDAMIHHPALAGRGYLVEEVRDRARCDWSGIVVTFRAEPVPWTPPWARSERR